MPVMIHGSEYTTVGERLLEFRKNYPEFSIQNTLVSFDEKEVVMKTEIYNENGRLIASGHAHEKRNASKILTTSALEVAETSSCGRALAFFGLSGNTQIASAEEVRAAIKDQGQGQPMNPRGNTFSTSKYSDDELALRACGNELELLASWKSIYARIKGDAGALQYLSGIKDECKAVL